MNIVNLNQANCKVGEILDPAVQREILRRLFAFYGRREVGEILAQLIRFQHLIQWRDKQEDKGRLPDRPRTIRELSLDISREFEGHFTHVISVAIAFEQSYAIGESLMRPIGKESGDIFWAFYDDSWGEDT
jgi:hypothetical protein